MKKKYIITILILDLIVIWFWIKWIAPTSSQSLAIILVVPVAFTINIIISLIYLLIKNKKNALIFFINSIVCSVLTAFVFSYQIDLSVKKSLDYYKFVKNDSTFSICIWKQRNEFDINYNKCKNCSTQLVNGEYIQKKDSMFLINNSNQFIIHNEYLYGYDKKPIRLTKKD